MLSCLNTYTGPTRAVHAHQRRARQGHSWTDGGRVQRVARCARGQADHHLARHKHAPQREPAVRALSRTYHASARVDATQTSIDDIEDDAQLRRGVPGGLSSQMSRRRTLK